MNADVERGPQGHRRWRMDYIADPDLFKAVAFSRKMIAEGKPPGMAHGIAANYYRVSFEDVAHYAAQYAGSMSHKRSKTR